MATWLGIDFGTCSTRAAFLWEGRVVGVKDPIRHLFTFPSSAFLAKNGELLLGQAAEARAKTDGDRYRREFKRDLGTGHTYDLRGTPLTPESLVTAMLRLLKAEADKTFAALTDKPFAGAVLTVPASYKKHKRELMERCGLDAGFAQVHLLEEPVAAAQAYADEARPGLADGDVLLVYDLGGGTFDAALLQKRADSYAPLAEAVGLEYCGGVDFDRAIYYDLLTRFPVLAARLAAPPGDSYAWRLRQEITDSCREIKLQLSAFPSYEYGLPDLDDAEYLLTRPAFDAMIEPLLAESLAKCRHLVQSAGMEWAQVRGVLLVGGSCRIPCVAATVAQAFGRPVLGVSDPEMAVCRGAALYQKTIPTALPSPAPELPALTAVLTRAQQQALNAALVSEWADNGKRVDAKAKVLTVPSIQAALNTGADIETKDRHGRSVMIIAATYGHLEIVRLLLDRGANMEATDSDGSTALMKAALFGHLEIARLLLDRGADKNAKDNNGWTALSHAKLLFFTPRNAKLISLLR